MAIRPLFFFDNDAFRYVFISFNGDSMLAHSKYHELINATSQLFVESLQSDKCITLSEILYDGNKVPYEFLARHIRNIIAKAEPDTALDWDHHAKHAVRLYNHFKYSKTNYELINKNIPLELHTAKLQKHIDSLITTSSRTMGYL